jgi:DNA-binding PadR family transcriptional regulator
VLELAVLGLLHSTPMHGYELRKRLNEMLGLFRPFSYGSLYPCLKALADRGAITASDKEPAGAAGLASQRRAKIVYRLTEAGSTELEQLLGQAGPASWEDENFDVRFALFAQTDVETRLRVLEGRRARMAERLDLVLGAINRGGPTDAYTAELQRHTLDQVQREVRWLEDLIEVERGSRRTARREPRPLTQAALATASASPTLTERIKEHA